MKQNILILIVLISSYCNVQGQTDTATIDLTFTQMIDSVFGVLDVSKISTGYLRNKTLTLVNWDDYIGAQHSPQLQYNTAMELYSEIYYAQTNDISIPTAQALDEEANIYNKESKIPLLVFSHDYDQFVADAFSSNKLVVENMQIIPQISNESALYQQQRMSLICPMISKITANSCMDIVFSQRFVFSDEPISTIWMRVGEDWKEISPSSSQRLCVQNEDSIILHFRLGKDNHWEYSNVVVSVAKTNDDKSPKPSEPITFFSVEGQEGEHQFGIWYGCDKDLANPCLRKPIVLVDGYDPPDRRVIQDDPNNPSDAPLYDLVNQEGMADKLRAEGFDLVILNYASGLVPIQDKAKAVETLITNHLNPRMMECGSNHEYIWIGPSEGGLVVRYALAEMEQNGQDHNTRLFISFDAPNQGANLPLASQHYLNFLFDAMPYLWLLNDTRFIMDGMLNSTPTKQMLRFHHTGHNGQTVSEVADFINFQNDMHQLNGGLGYPKICRNVAISNGSASAANQGFNAGDKLFGYNLTTFYLPILGNVVPNIWADGWSMPNGGNNFKIFGGVAAFNAGIISIPIPYLIRNKKVDNAAPIDNAPGGRADFPQMVGDLLDQSLGFLFSANVNNQNTCFIPEISALDLQNTNFHTDLFYNMLNNHASLTYDGIGGYESFSLGPVTPFDGVYVEEVNDEHVIDGVTPSIAAFVDKEIMPNHLYLQNRILQNNIVDFEGNESIEVGRAVTNRIAKGKFVIEPTAKATLHGGKSITLKNGFVAKKGSIVKAYVEKVPDYECPVSKPQNNSTVSSPQTVSTLNTAQRENLFFTVYPNPASTEITISFDAIPLQSIEITILDAIGREVMRTILSNKMQQKYPIQLENGLYYCVFKQNNAIIGSEKLLIIK